MTSPGRLCFLRQVRPAVWDMLHVSSKWTKHTLHWKHRMRERQDTGVDQHFLVCVTKCCMNTRKFSSCILMGSLQKIPVSPDVVPICNNDPPHDAKSSPNNIGNILLVKYFQVIRAVPDIGVVKAGCRGILWVCGFLTEILVFVWFFW